jgi:hypothetical protein
MDGSTDWAWSVMLSPTGMYAGSVLLVPETTIMSGGQLHWLPPPP